MLKAQNGAFYFDGVDDFIKYSPTLKFADLEDVQRGSSVELIFKIDDLQSGAILISQQSQVTEQVNGLGYNAQGQLYHYLNGEEFLVEGIYFDMNKCYHLSVLYGSATTQYYLNGNLVMVEPALPQQPFFYNDHPFYFGKAPQVQNTHFNGVISEVRLFGDQRSQLEINHYLFSRLDFFNDHIFAVFAFNNLVGHHTYGYFGADHVIGVLGDGDIEFTPEWIPDRCIPETESVSATHCPPSSPCVPSGAPNELLCNGNFAQYCSALLDNHWMWGTAGISGVFPHFAFDDFWNPNMSPGSDVNGWELKPHSIPPSTNVYPPSGDFYVPYGIGSPTGNWIIPNWTGFTNSIPTTNWNGVQDNSGMVAALAGEGFTTNLVNHTLQPNSTYTFSGWFYLSSFNRTVNNPNLIGTMEITFDDGVSNTSTYSAGTVQMLLAESVQNNFGWEFKTFAFTTPSNLPNGLTRFNIENISTAGGTYIFADNLSLQTDAVPNIFPQYTHSGTDNDLHHRVIKVDNNNDVYALINVENITPSTAAASIGVTSPSIINISSGKKGSIMVKYDQLGNVLWAQYYDALQIVDFDFKSNGEIVAVGHSFSTIPSPGVTLQSVLSGCGISDIESIQIIFMTINHTNGNQNTLLNTGSIHTEKATGVAVINDVAYFSVEYNLLNCSGIDEYWWATPGVGGFSESSILAYDFATLSRLEPPFNLPASFDNPRSLKKDGSGGFFVLTDTEIYHITSPQSNNPVISSSPLNTADPTYLEPEFNTNNAFVLYADKSTVELYDPGVGLLSSFSTASNKHPIAATSSVSGDYVMYYQPSTSMDNTTSKVVSVEKLDPNGTFGSPMWSVESTSHNATFVTNFQTFSYSQVGDLVHFPNLNGQLAITGSFSNIPQPISGLPTPWVMNFGSKGLSANAASTYGHTFVTTLTDFGTSASFKRKGVLSTISELRADESKNTVIFYPNPSNSGMLNLVSNKKVDKVIFYNTEGKQLFEKKIIDYENTIDISSLNPGIYLVEARGASFTQHERVLVQ